MADDFEAAVAEPATTFSFHGEEFRIAESIGLMPLMKFAHAARSGLDTAEMEGLAAMHDILRDCLVPEDFPRFEQLCTDKKLDGDAIFGAVKDLIGAVAARPTLLPSDSSDGQLSTSESSKGDSSTGELSPQERRRAMGLVPVDEVFSSAV